MTIYQSLKAADETNSDLGQMAVKAIQIAKDTARYMGMNENEAMISATEGIFEAAESISEGAAEEVEATLFQEDINDRDEYSL